MSDIEITDVELVKPIWLRWDAKGIGFGELIFKDVDGKIECENECMSKEFVKAVLCKMVDDSEMMEPK